MTATIRPPERGSHTRGPLRVTSLETLGFSDAVSVWSDTRPRIPLTPSVPPVGDGRVVRRGRHEAPPPPEPDTVADWVPAEFGGRLTGSNIRWALVAVIVTLVAGAAVFGYWLYQRPGSLQEASTIEVTARATALETALPALEEFNSGLLTADPITGTSSLFAVESEARALFEASGGLATSQSELRRAASEAAASALDGIRLASETHSYRVAVLPILQIPDLVTDRSLIELDEAARSFGDWQLSFDNVRTALPESVMSDVTLRLDVLSTDLPSFLTSYVDALREDDSAAARTAVSDLSARLDEIGESLADSVEGIQTRVSLRIEETRQALHRLLQG